MNSPKPARKVSPKSPKTGQNASQKTGPEIGVETSPTASQKTDGKVGATGPEIGPEIGVETGRKAGPVVTVVIPTIGRPSLAATLAAIGPGPEVVVVDDRPGSPDGSAPLPMPLAVPDRVRVLRSGGRGPAAARNAGWGAATTPWVAFLDDDVVPSPGWAGALVEDLAGLPENIAGSQGLLEVPLPDGRRPTDAERNTAGLVTAQWITADIAYRRSALEATGGFDERFSGAYREDADLALRVERAGFSLVRGWRVTRHPVREDGFWSSVRFQRGNADDALMRRVHGPGWRAAIGGFPGRLKRHAVITTLGLLAVALSGAAAVQAGQQGRSRLAPIRWSSGGSRRAAIRWGAGKPPRAGSPPRGLVAAAGAAGLGWLGLTAEFAWARIAPGPRTPEEILRMAVTSMVIPPVACAHRLRGEVAVRKEGRR